MLETQTAGLGPTADATRVHHGTKTASPEPADRAARVFRSRKAKNQPARAARTRERCDARPHTRTATVPSCLMPHAKMRVIEAMHTRCPSLPLAAPCPPLPTTRTRRSVDTAP
eukprot:5209741-Prymnesium_polylepis.1